ncbi:hypothetical protein ACFO3E_04805 [Sphingobium tyrosinilyticum]|uniref:Uncharacterized protein n=2 Tax=Sphingobium tyrosinilyticum TaxID=2715436 RepID=A0ABV9EXC2_9SPHN
MTEGLGDQHPTARQLQAEANRLRLGAEALDRASANRSPLDTPEAHALKVAKMARKLDSEVKAYFNRSAQIWAAGRSDVQQRIDDKVNLRPDAFASEIRAAFRSLPVKKQGQLIQDLVDGNRGPELAAIVRAPSVLTGITDAQRQAYEQMIVAKHAAAEQDELAQVDEIYEAVSTMSRAAGDMARSFIDPGALSNIERADAAASEARSAFDQSFQ